MRYQVIDVYHQHPLQHYLAECITTHSPQFVVIQSTRILCIGFDILDVNEDHSSASSAMGEDIALKILKQFDYFDKSYISAH